MEVECSNGCMAWLPLLTDQLALPLSPLHCHSATTDVALAFLHQNKMSLNKNSCYRAVGKSDRHQIL